MVVYYTCAQMLTEQLSSSVGRGRVAVTPHYKPEDVVNMHGGIALAGKLDQVGTGARVWITRKTGVDRYWC